MKKIFVKHNEGTNEWINEYLFSLINIVLMTIDKIDDVRTDEQSFLSNDNIWLSKGRTFSFFLYFFIQTQPEL